jgi:hypothetical protein
MSKASFFKNAQGFEVNGGHFGDIQQNNFYGAIYGSMETAIANYAPVNACQITVDESHSDYGQHKQASPSPGKNSDRLAIN